MDPMSKKTPREIKLENALKELAAVAGIVDAKLSYDTRKTLESLKQGELLVSAYDKLTLPEIEALGLLCGYPILSVKTNVIDALKDDFAQRARTTSIYSSPFNVFFAYESGHVRQYDGLYVPIADDTAARLDIALEELESLGTKWSKYRCTYKYNI